MQDPLLDEHALQVRLRELDFGGKEDREFEVQRRARLAPRAMPRRGRPQHSRPEHDLGRRTKTQRDSERHSHAPTTRTLPRSPPMPRTSTDCDPPYVSESELMGFDVEAYRRKLREARTRYGIQNTSSAGRMCARVEIMDTEDLRRAMIIDNIPHSDLMAAIEEDQRQARNNFMARTSTRVVNVHGNASIDCPDPHTAYTVPHSEWEIDYIVGDTDRFAYYIKRIEPHYNVHFNNDFERCVKGLEVMADIETCCAELPGSARPFSECHRQLLRKLELSCTGPHRSLGVGKTRKDEKLVTVRGIPHDGGDGRVYEEECVFYAQCGYHKLEFNWLWDHGTDKISHLYSKIMSRIKPYVPPPKLEGPFDVWGRYSPHYDDTLDDDDVKEQLGVEHRAAANAADTGLQRTLRHITAARDYEGVH